MKVNRPAKLEDVRYHETFTHEGKTYKRVQGNLIGSDVRVGDQIKVRPFRRKEETLLPADLVVTVIRSSFTTGPH